MADSPFVIPPAPTVFTLPFIGDQITAADVDAGLVAWIPPGQAVIGQFQAAVSTVLVGAETCDVTLESFDLDNLAAGPTTLAVITLDLKHTDDVKLLSVSVTPRTLLRVSVTGGGGLAAHDVCGSVTGTM